MKKILFIHGSADLYGASQILISTLKGLDKKLAKPVVLLPYEEKLDLKIRSLGIPVEIGPIAVLRRQNFNFIGFLLFVNDLFRSLFFIRKLDNAYNFDAIFTSTSAVISGALYAKLFGKKHIWHILEITSKPKFFKYIMPHFINMFSNLCICLSGAVKQYISSGKTEGFKSKIIYCGTALSNNTNCVNASVSQNRITFGMIGRLNRLKGQEVFIKAAALTMKERQDLHFLLVGSPFKNEEKFLDRVKILVSELHLEKDIDILGFTENIACIYKQIDIVVVPSTEPEAFGLVAVEAMAMKKAVIASDIGGLPEVVIDKETGILFEAGNAEQLKDAMLKLADDAALRKKMGETGFRRQQLYFTEEKYTEEIGRTIMSFLEIKSK